jgi:hypothetical protein
VLVILAALIAVVEASCDRRVARAGFWFDDVTFDVPAFTQKFGSPIIEHEKKTIESVARSELRTAYSGLRISFTDTSNAFYRVRVVQRFPGRHGYRSAGTAESLTFGPLGGHGSINFEFVAALAVNYGPPDSKRAAIIEAIGRGIGRVAVHELAHQILATEQMDVRDDRESYEYAATGQSTFYGPMHWGGARRILLEKLGAAF